MRKVEWRWKPGKSGRGLKEVLKHCVLPDIGCYKPASTPASMYVM